MLFNGSYERSIDAKQRLAIPSQVRHEIDREKAGPTLFAVVLQVQGPTLCLYTENDFRRLAELLDDSTKPAEEILQFEQVFFASARRVDIDKQGRIRLPEQLLEMAELKNDVVLLGVKDHLEVHDRLRWTQQRQQMLADNPKLMINPRLMR
ncbi:MAG: hypothetical protein CMJ49_12125 [Planctomycetaceae bacterium]|nr:hypothetical protein [Planctomycetaceae bacterium]